MNQAIKVLLTRDFFEEDLNYLKTGLADNVQLIRPSDFSADALQAAVKGDIHVLLGEPPGADVLDLANSLRLIQIPWTGVDRLDFSLLKRYPYPVCNSHSNARMVAEYAVGLMLAVTKQIPIHDRRLRAGDWCRPLKQGHSHFIPPEPLAGKTVGLIGYGAIGKEIAQLLSGFSFRFCAVARRGRESIPPPLSMLVESDKMGFIAEESDIIFVTLPLTAATRGCIDKEIFSRMKPNAYLINISRGNLVVESDLFYALSNKRIAGAAIDTWYNYPTATTPKVLPSSKFPFHQLDNLVLSPHRSGFGRGTLSHLDDAIENINRLASGEPLINQIDLTAEY